MSRYSSHCGVCIISDSGAALPILFCFFINVLLFLFSRKCSSPDVLPFPFKLQPVIDRGFLESLPYMVYEYLPELQINFFKYIKAISISIEITFNFSLAEILITLEGHDQKINLTAAVVFVLLYDNILQNLYQHFL